MRYLRWFSDGSIARIGEDAVGGCRMDAERIVERFRMAAFGMDDWAGGLAAVARATGTNAVHLCGFDAAGALAFNLVTGATDDMVAEFLVEGGLDPAMNPRTRMVREGVPLRCMTDADLVDDATRAALPIYRGLFRRGDIEHAAIVRLAMPGGTGGIAAMRGRSAGAMGVPECAVIDAIAPALSDIVGHATRLGTAQEGATLTTVEALGCAALLLDGAGRCVAMSQSAEALLAADGPLTLWRGQVVARDRAGAATLGRAIGDAIDLRSGLRGACRVILRCPGGALPVTIEVTALPQRGSGPLSRARAMLMRRASPPEPSAEWLAAAYTLTAAEAAVAVLLARGHDAAAIAERRGSGVATVRSQIKALLEKTGTRRQGELIVKLLAGG